MKLVVTDQFEQAVKSLKKDHNTRALAELSKTVTKIHDMTVGSSQRNHPLKNANGLKDVHIFGDKLIVLYRYDTDSDTLIVSAKLHNVVDHNKLSRKGVFDEKPGTEKELDDVLDTINSATYLDIEDTEEINNFILRIYNRLLSKYIPVDDFSIDRVSVRDNYILVQCSGVQYKRMINFSDFVKRASRCEDAMQDSGLSGCEIVRYDDSPISLRDDAYDVEFRFEINLE